MTARERLTEALGNSDEDTAQVISADVNEVCSTLDNSDALVAKLVTEHRYGVNELHPISADDLERLLAIKTDSK